jgi:peptidoglycan/LPS O-acetylase OafA/YrhL
MVFFVLSGLLISGSVTRDFRLRRWSWAKYVASRGARLYMVLVPGLLLTLLWDELGLSLFSQNPIYSGAPRPWLHDYFPVAERIDLATLAGNLVFLQTIRVPPLGSNDPLWSLSYEFWYYVLFPCLWLALFTARPPWQRLACAGVAAVVFLGVGSSILLYFPIWLLGAAVGLLPRARVPRGKPAFLLTSAAFLAFLAAAVAGHVGGVRAALGNSVVAADYLTAVGFAVFLYLLLHHDSPGTSSRYTRVAGHLAGFSYSLYVLHMPLLVFLRALLIPDRPWTPDAANLLAAAALCAIAVVYALLLSRPTEAKTEALRGCLMRVAGRLSLRPERA